jgi:hypothetical protein
MPLNQTDFTPANRWRPHSTTSACQPTCRRWAPRPRRLRFTSESFILSFSLPNFHFHATTTYAILRMKGAPIGKRDYEGRLRVSAVPRPAA